MGRRVVLVLLGNPLAKAIASIVQERIRDLLQQQEQLKHELAQASVPKQRLVNEANRKFEAALALFSKLRQSLIRSDFKTLRDCLEKTIDKVVVKVGNLLSYYGAWRVYFKFLVKSRHSAE